MNDLLRRLLNLPAQASTYSSEIDHLHYFVITITMIGATFVFVAAIYFTVRYRQASAVRRRTPRVIASVRLEALEISGVLGLFLFVWIVGFRQYMRVEIAPPETLDVYVVAKQWMWKFTYPEGPASAGVLYVPVHRAVKLVMTSRDVIHSFFVPAFRLKQDVVPGRYTTAWFEATQTGRFPIRCAEYCGTRHAEMLGEVIVLDQRDYEQWLLAPERNVVQSDVLALRGERVAADLGCLRCHTLDGTPHIGPTWTGLFGKTEHFADGTTLQVDAAYLTESMMDPAVRIVAGYQPVMPSYQGRMEPAEAAAIVELIKSLHAGDERSTHPNPLPVGGAPP